jgi:hypothetical protein
MNKEDRVFDVIGMSPRDDKDGRSFWDEFFDKGSHLPDYKYAKRSCGIVKHKTKRDTMNKAPLFTEEFAKGFSHAILVQGSLYNMREDLEEMVKKTSDVQNCDASIELNELAYQCQHEVEQLLKKFGLD